MKYLLLILPFMWGCAEKKDTVTILSADDALVLVLKNNDTTIYVLPDKSLMSFRLPPGKYDTGYVDTIRGMINIQNPK